MTNIKIDEIKCNSDLMMRQALDKSLVATYADNIQEILSTSPIEVFKINGEYILTDGFHRTAAARQSGLVEISANVREGTLRDARAAACLANLRHGKALTRDERKNAICVYIKLSMNGKGINYRGIAKETGVSHSTIENYCRELEAHGEIEIHQTVKAGTNGKKLPLVKNDTKEIQPEQIDPFEVWFNEHVSMGDALDILPTIGRKKFDLAIVDPPYGITTEKWDLTNKHELVAFTRQWLTRLLKVLKPSARLYIFWSREYMFDLKPLLDEIQETYPMNFGGMLVWNFRNVQSMPDNRKQYKMGWEPIFYYYGLEALDFDTSPYSKVPQEVTGETWKGKGDVQSDVWHFDDVFEFAIPQSNFGDKRVHPTQKPLDLYKRIIETATHIGDSIIDPFAGSGTTGHAAHELEREFRLIEQNPEYISLMSQRLKSIWKFSENGHGSN